MRPCEEMKATKTSRDTCLPSGHSSSSVWPVTSWAEFNQEGHLCLSGTQNNRYSGIQPCSSQSHSPLPIPDLHRGSAECQVQLQYQLSGIGVRSKWDSEKSEIHTPTPNRTKKLRSKPPSPESCNGSGRLPLCTIAIWANPREPQWWIAGSQR